MTATPATTTDAAREQLCRVMDDHLHNEATADLDTMIASLADDVVHELAGARDRFAIGKEAVAERYRWRFRTFEFHGITNVRRLYGDDFVVSEDIVEATVNGTFMGLKGRGRRIRMRHLHILTVRDGLIVHEYGQPDYAEVLAQLADPAPALQPSHAGEATLHTYFAAIDRGDLDAAAALFAPDCIVHRPDQAGAIHGRDGVRRLLGATLAPYTCFATTVEDVFADGDRLCARITHHATQDGGWHSRLGAVEAHGVPVTLRAIAIMRFENGLIAEQWVSRDELGMLLQLGALDGQALRFA